MGIEQITEQARQYGQTYGRSALTKGLKVGSTALGKSARGFDIASTRLDERAQRMNPDSPKGRALKLGVAALGLAATGLSVAKFMRPSQTDPGEAYPPTGDDTTIATNSSERATQPVGQAGTGTMESPITGRQSL